MAERKASIPDSETVKELRDIGIIPSQHFNELDRNCLNEASWYETIEKIQEMKEKNKTGDEDSCSPQVLRFLRRALKTIVIQGGFTEEIAEELCDSWVKGGKIQ